MGTFFMQVCALLLVLRQDLAAQPRLALELCLSLLSARTVGLGHQANCTLFYLLNMLTQCMKTKTCKQMCQRKYRTPGGRRKGQRNSSGGGRLLPRTQAAGRGGRVTRKGVWLRQGVLSQAEQKLQAVTCLLPARNLLRYIPYLTFSCNLIFPSIRTSHALGTQYISADLNSQRGFFQAIHSE